MIREWEIESVNTQQAHNILARLTGAPWSCQEDTVQDEPERAPETDAEDQWIAVHDEKMGNECEVCHAEPSVGVACVPGVPISVAYGQACLEANAHPYGIVVANTALCGGYELTDEWWQQMIKDTLGHLHKTWDEFNADVAQAITDFEREMHEHEAKQGDWTADLPPEFRPGGDHRG